METSQQLYDTYCNKSSDVLLSFLSAGHSLHPLFLASLSRCLKRTRGSSHPERLIGRTTKHDENEANQDESDQCSRNLLVLVEWMWSHLDDFLSCSSLEGASHSSVEVYFRLCLVLDILKTVKDTDKSLLLFYEKKDVLLLWFKKVIDMKCNNNVPNILKLCDILSFLLKVNMSKVTDKNKLSEESGHLLNCIDLLMSLGDFLTDSCLLTRRVVLDDESCSLIDNDELMSSVRSSLIMLLTLAVKKILEYVAQETSSVKNMIRITKLLESLSSTFNKIICLLKDHNMSLIELLIMSNDKEMIQILLTVEEISISCSRISESLLNENNSNEVKLKASCVTAVKRLFSLNNSLDTLTLFVSLLKNMSFNVTYFVDIISDSQIFGLEYILRVLKRTQRHPEEVCVSCHQIRSMKQQSKLRMKSVSSSDTKMSQPSTTAKTVILLKREEMLNDVTKNHNSDEILRRASVVMEESQWSKCRVSSVEWEENKAIIKEQEQSDGSDVENELCELDVVDFLRSYCSEVESMTRNRSLPFDCSSLIKKLKLAIEAIESATTKKNNTS